MAARKQQKHFETESTCYGISHKSGPLALIQNMNDVLLVEFGPKLIPFCGKLDRNNASTSPLGIQTACWDRIFA